MRRVWHTGLSAAKAELLAGLAEVLLLLSRATQLRDALGHGTSAAGPDPLMSACLQAQAWLRSLLTAHDDRKGQPARPQWEVGECESAEAETARSSAGPLGGALDGGAAAAAAAAGGDGQVLTWTGEMGAHDVHSRLFGEADGRDAGNIL